MLSTAQQLHTQPAARAIHALAAAARTVGHAFPSHLLENTSRQNSALGIRSGIPVLDQLLGNGFPKSGLIELLPSPGAHGEIELLIGALASLGRAVWVLAEHNPFVPNGAYFEARGIDLSQQLFVVPESPEEAFDIAARTAASGEADAVVAWLAPLHSSEDFRALRRLALAAETAGIPIFAIRPAAMACTNSPAKLRLQLYRSGRASEVRVRAHFDNPLYPIVREAVIELADRSELTNTAAICEETSLRKSSPHVSQALLSKNDGRPYSDLAWAL